MKYLKRFESNDTGLIHYPKSEDLDKIIPNHNLTDKLINFYLNWEPSELDENLIKRIGQLKLELKDLLSDDIINKINSLQSILFKLKQIREIQHLGNVYITKFKERNGSECYLAKINYPQIDEFGKPHKLLVSVYMGKTDLYKSKDDPKLLELAKKKIIDKLLTLI